MKTEVKNNVSDATTPVNMKTLVKLCPNVQMNFKLTPTNVFCHSNMCALQHMWKNLWMCHSRPQ